MPRKPDYSRGELIPWRNLALLLMIVLALAATVSTVRALAYYFAVPVNTIDVYINEDGTASIDYFYRFDNQPRADPIEYVDIGMPTTSYDMGSVTATVNEQPVSGVEKSTEAPNAIALNLGSRAIPPGQSGDVRAFIPTVRRLLFKATGDEKEPYASFQFQPNFFGSQYVTGKTEMTVTLHLPPGIQTEEPRYFPPKNWPGAEEPESGRDEKGNIYYSWHTTDASVARQYAFGASFPARVVPANTLLTELPASGGVSVNFGAWLCPVIFFLGFFGFIVLTIRAAVQSDKKRKLQYLPPRVSVEGNGIKRGLTAVEAAILMQQPMDKILTMILFAVTKKNAARVVSREPMKLEILQPQPEDMRTYETEFVQAMGKTNVAEQRRGLQDMMTNLVKSVSEKMRGFSRQDTVTYYDDIMKKAWQQVEQAQTPEMKMKAFDDAMDWTMLDRRFDDRTRDTFGPRPVILPTWWGNFDPRFGHGSTGGASVSRPSAPSIPSAGNTPPQGASLPSLPGAEFAGSMVAGMQNFSGNIIGDLTAFTGGVTQKTNPPPPPPPVTRSGGGTRGGGGGHSCVCACACACAGCACACAGGGR